MKHFLSSLLLFLIAFYNPGSVVAKDSSFKTEEFRFVKVKPTIANEPATSIFASVNDENSLSLNDLSSIIKLIGSDGEIPTNQKIYDQPTKNKSTTSLVNAILQDSTNATEKFSFKQNTFKPVAKQQKLPNSPIALSVNGMPDVTLNSTEYIGVINGSPGFKYCNTAPDILFTNGSTTVATNTGYVISWGDGSPDFTGTFWNSMTHYYTFGLWTLTYTITGEMGNTLTKQYKILVSSYANVSFGSDNSSKDICIGSDYSFLISNTGSNPDGTIYTLTFNDGTEPIVYTTSPPPKVTHTFNKSSCGYTSVTATGTYINSFSATIVASSLCGTNAVTVAPIYVSSPPKAKITLSSPEICANVETTITDNSTGYEITSADPICKPPKRVWEITPSSGVTLSKGSYGNDFGNNSPTTWISGSSTISPIFSIPGTYTIKLKAGNFCGTDEIETTIVVQPALLPQFNIINEGCAPFSVTAQNTTDFTGNPTGTCLWEVTYSPGNCGTLPGIWNFAKGTDKNSINPTFNFSTPGVYILKLSLFNICGVVTTSQTIQVTTPPQVTINEIANSCDAAKIHPVAIVDGCAPATTALTYLWSFPGGIPVTSSALTPGTINYSASGTYTVSLKVTNPECGSSTTSTKSFTVNTTPVVDQPLNQEVCQGSKTANITFSGSIPNAIYTWTNNNTTIGLSAAGTGNIFSFKTVNATTSPITATIHVTPTINGCTGTTKTFTITVNPIPVITLIPNMVLCNGVTSKTVNLTGNVTGMTYSWTNDTPSIGLPDSGTGNIPSFTTINNGIVPVNATITVLPAATGCSGTPRVFTITVYPISKVNSIKNVVLCDQQISENISLTGNVTGTTFTWTNDTPSIGLAASGSGVIPSFNTVNNGTVPVNAIVRVTPSVNGCVGTPLNFVITVNPIVTVNDVTGQIVCNNFITSEIIFSGNTSDATYSWINSNPSIGLAANGTGNISPFTAINTGYTSIIDTITVTPILKGCNGTPKQILITVNPTSKVSPIGDVDLCYHQTSDVIKVTGNVTGSTYTWSNDTPAIGLAASGTGDIPSFISENSGVIPLKATITVIPTAYGCSELPYVFTITVNPVVTVNNIVNQIVCDNSLTTDINISGNSPEATYTWINSNPTIGLPATGTGNIAAFKALNSGTTTLISTITVTPNTNGCNGSPETFTITVYPMPEVKPITDRINCNKELAGSIALPGNVAGSTITWTNDTPSIGLAASGTGDIPGYTANNTGNIPVKATITVIPSANGCTGTPYSFNITINPAPGIKSKYINLCNGNTFSFIPVDGNGSIVPPYTHYVWNEPVLNPAGSITGSSSQLIPQDSISQTLTNLLHQTATATYTVIPTTGSCSGNPFTIVVTVNPAPDILFSIPNQTIASGKTSLLITFPAVTNGIVKYNWTIDVPKGITGEIMPDSNSINPQKLVNTTSQPLTVTYTVTSAFVDGSTCGGISAIYTITVLPLITTTSITSGFNGFNISVTDGTDGWIDVTVAGGSGTYTYTWTGPDGFTSSTQDITDLPAGDYTLTITDGYSDPVVLKFTLTDPLLLIIQEDLTSHVNIACHADSTGIIKISILQSSVGPYDYSLENKSGTTVAQVKNTTAENYIFSGLPAGIYLAKVTDANGHFKEINGIVISEPTELIISVSSVNAACPGTNTGSATLIAVGSSGTYTYSWNTVPVQTTATASGLVAGNYTGTVTDSNGCTKMISVKITDPSEIQIVSPLKKDNTCFGAMDGEISISVTGGTPDYDFTWTKDGLPYAKTKDLTQLNTGEYTVSVTDKNGCTPKTATFTVNEPPAITINLIAQQNLTCFGDSTGAVEVEVAGGTPHEINAGVFEYHYSWSGPYGYTSRLKDLKNLKAGVYILTVTDEPGCSKEFQVTIMHPDQLVLSVETKQISCYGSNDASIKISISGGVKPYQIKWSNLGSGTLQDNLSPGTYSVTVIDSLGCTKTETVIISQAKFYINPSVTPVTCFGAHDGSIHLNISGGVQPVKLVWEDNSTDGNVRNNLGPGSYTAYISDASSCSFKQIFIVREPLKLELSAAITNAFDCTDQNSGTINLQVTGGTSPYSYEWSNHAITGKISGIPAGNYFVTVTDSNGCKITEQYQVLRQVPIKIGVSSRNDYNCLTKIIKVINTADIAGGVPPYQLKWSSGTVSGTNNEIMETTQSGMVTLQVSDGIGCTAFSSFNVEIRNPGIKYQMLDCNKFAFQFNAVVPNENESYTYSWDFGDGNISSIQNVQHVYNSTGNFTVELILKSESCTSYYKEIVNVESGPVLSINKIPSFCNGDSLIIHVTGAQTYRWSDNSVSDSIVIKHVGSYNVTGISNTGCVSMLSFVASKYEITESTIQADRNEVTNDNKPLHLWTYNDANSQYYWDFGDGKTDQGNDITHVFDITTDGYYDVKLRITNLHGCVQEVTKRIWIIQNATPNTFTPNGDGKNDVFMKDWHIQVYNRNGILLYDGRDGWDGTQKGVPVMNDTYFYVVYYSAESGLKTSTGFVTIIR